MTTTTITSNGYANGSDVAKPKIVLYTNHRCPYAQRAHITLDELNLPYEEVLIDLDSPRPQWYLDINPRGLVPSIKYSLPGVYDDEQVVTESAIVAQFLADSFPSHLLPASGESPIAPLQRARIGFFVDTWGSKVGTLWFQVMMAEDGEKEAKVDAWVEMTKKEIEPLLKGARPFFGGSDKLTFAEVIAAPFVLRFYALAEDGEMIPKSLIEKFDQLPNFGPWARAVRQHPTVTKVWDEKGTVEVTKNRIKSMKAKK